MVRGSNAYLAGLLRALYESIDWTKRTTCKLQAVFSVGGTLWLLHHGWEKYHTRSAMTWTAIAPFIVSHQQDLGNHTNDLTPVGFEPLEVSTSEYLSEVRPTLNHLSFGLTVLYVYQRYIGVYFKIPWSENYTRSDLIK